MLFAPRFRRAPSEKAVIRFCWWLYLLLSRILTVSLPPSACSNPLCRHPPLPPRRSPLVLRLFALALADGSGLPFSLHPPPAALESQTPQREARAFPRQRTESKNAAHFFTLHYCFPAAHAVSPRQRFWWNPQGGRAAPRQVPPPKQRLLNPQQRQRRRAAPAGFFLR